MEEAVLVLQHSGVDIKMIAGDSPGELLKLLVRESGSKSDFVLELQ